METVTPTTIITWGPQVREERLRRRISQGALAEAVGVRQWRLCEWEKGYVPCNCYQYHELIAALDRLAPEFTGRPRKTEEAS